MKKVFVKVKYVVYSCVLRLNSVVKGHTIVAFPNNATFDSRDFVEEKPKDKKLRIKSTVYPD